MLYPYAELLPQEIVERAKKLSSTLICDGISKAGLNIPNGGAMDAAIMPVGRKMQMVGTAATVETDNGDNFPIHIASYSAPTDGYVMVIDGKGYQGRAYAGDLIMGACKAIGFTGIVCDGLTRDRDGNIDELDNYPVFSKGFCPRGPYKKAEGNINIPIFCGGVLVNPGDLVVGDSDGVVVVPRIHIETVLQCAEEKADYEEKRTATISAYMDAKRNNKPLPQLAPQWVYDMLNNSSPSQVKAEDAN